VSGGGCSCDWCGAIYVAHEWEDGMCRRCSAASADTHPKGGDVQQAPAPLSGAVSEGQTPNPSSNTYSSSPPKEQR